MIERFTLFGLGFIPLVLGIAQVFAGLNGSAFIVLPLSPWHWLAPLALIGVGVLCIARGVVGYFRDWYFAEMLVGILALILAGGIIFSPVETNLTLRGSLIHVMTLVLIVGGFIGTRVRLDR